MMSAAALVAAPVFALYASTAAPTIITRFGGADGGELTAAAISGGVPHPTGYPTYMLLARIALLLPFGEPAGRLALLSACCGALAAGCTGALVAKLNDHDSGSHGAGIRLASGVYAGLALATGTRFWSQAIIAEVYALHMLCLTFTVLLLSVWLESGRPWQLVGAALVLGLGLGNHVTLLALVPAGWLAWICAPKWPPLSSRILALALGALVAGLSVYGVLPIWAMRAAVPSWGDLQTLAGFWAHVSGAEYRFLAGMVPWPDRLQRLGFVARDLGAQPGAAALLLALWPGLAWGWRRERSLGILTVGIGLVSLVFAVGYGGADSTAYLLPWTWAWTVSAGVGARIALEYVGRASGRWVWLRYSCWILLIGSMLVPAVPRYRALNLQAYTVERERIARILASLPRAAILLSEDDAETFGVWYLQQAFRMRRDVLVLDVRLIERSWYHRQIQGALGVHGAGNACAVLGDGTRPFFVAEENGGTRRLADSALRDMGVCED